ncbi:hypothetical protein SLI_5551 [Streptomyces lividans 1326]|uniref:Uncharacterized protein n=1 Tax=Streptomyces lividans 1326 TaxID=1200984 RepID=A0A7U9HDH9_STRLI|nr:hypothetical protein SLI_5551 [Streptomyces lividans 1326]
MPDPERRMSVTWLIARLPDNLSRPLDRPAHDTFNTPARPRSMVG